MNKYRILAAVAALATLASLAVVPSTVGAGEPGDPTRLNTDLEAGGPFREPAFTPDGQTVVIDGLAMGGLPGPVCDHSTRLRVIALVHHPLAEETGISADDQRRFRASERAALGCCAGVIVTSDFTAAASLQIQRLILFVSAASRRRYDLC